MHHIKVEISQVSLYNAQIVLRKIYYSYLMLYSLSSKTLKTLAVEINLYVWDEPDWCSIACYDNRNDG